MWWCCGKRGKDQPGCKFGKHLCRGDDDKSDDEQQATQSVKHTRCACCKEVGHRIENCTRDPNFKTNQQVSVDAQRIQKISTFKKLHADTLVSTTHFMKRSIMVPIANEATTQEEVTNKNHPFMRGIMNFDDYNYTHFNEFVLL